MFNKENLREVLEDYKKAFKTDYFKNEEFKWIAVKHFQENWNLEAEDFASMFTQATDKTYNLLASMHNYPRLMIQTLADADQEATRAMFISLFDESKDLTDRMDQFISDAEMMRVRYGDTVWNQHFQNYNSISTYLWLRYPEKYYIYKYSEMREVTKVLDSPFRPTKGKSSDNITMCFDLYDEICEEIQKDTELIQMFNKVIDGKGYYDQAYRTLTFDVGFYISRYYNKENEKTEVEPPKVEVQEKQNDGPVNYWWLNANPKIWSLSSLAVGESHFYTLLNDNGNKRRIYQNFVDAKAGDMVIGYESNPVKQVVSLLKVTNDYDGKEFRFEKIEHLTTPIDYAFLKTLPELTKMEYFTNPNGSLFKLTKHEYDFILDVIREENPIKTEIEESYTKKDFLAEVYMTSERYDGLIKLLENKKNLILQGAPGVGKTFAAKRLAYSILGKKDESKIEFIQFHQNYAYEDFVMGYKPQGEGFALTHGIFYRFCSKALNNPDKPHFFIIDEINRGNMSKIFGELLMLIEKDYRGTHATLAYNGLSFTVPHNLYLIGMMNTADRSLAMIDYALRRRFSFFDMEPGFHSDGFITYQKSFNNEVFDELIERIIQLNREITQDSSLGRGFRIGHSYFCGQTECTEDWMRLVIEHDIIPMLHEYWFDEPQKVQKWENLLRGVLND